MEKDIGSWDPMKDHFYSDNKYENGPGVYMEPISENQEKREDKKIVIFISKLPSGITTDGIRNLLLNAGKPLKIDYFPDRRYALVQFATTKEAELALRDLNQGPPYYLHARFSRLFTADKRGEEAGENGNEIKNWTCESYHLPELNERIEQSRAPKEDEEGEKVKKGRESPYFNVSTEFTNPTLVMRQRNIDFQREVESISRGRGYFNSKVEDRFKPGCETFSSSSGDWDEVLEDVTTCSSCGNMTFGRDSPHVFCSNECDDLNNYDLVPQARHIFELFELGKTGRLDLLSATPDNRVPCAVILDEKEQDFSMLQELSYQYLRPFRAEIGDYVLCFRDEDPVRGSVLSREGDFVYISLFDYGEVLPTTDTFLLSRKLRDITMFGGLVTGTDAEFRNMNMVRFRVKRKKAFNTWACDLINAADEIVGEILLEPWEPPVLLRFVPLHSGSNVVMTSYIDTHTVCVRPIDASFNETFVKYNNEIALYAIDAPRYLKPPRCGEVCCAKYEQDKCFYRALVRTVTRKSVTVLFLDYGNEQETTLENLRYLPPAAKSADCFARRIQLKGIPDTATPEMVHYLNSLTAFGVELCLTYSGKKMRDVTLTERLTNVEVNQRLCDLSLPTWEKNPGAFSKLGEIFQVDSVDGVKFKMGAVVDGIFVLHIDVMEFCTMGKFYATPYNGAYLGHLNGELKRKIREYCTYLTENPYLPRHGEMCLVKVDDQWHRGLSLEDDKDASKIYLVDRGDTVTAKAADMRKILKEFLEMPTLALECRVWGFDKLTQRSKKRLADYLSSMVHRIITKGRVVAIKKEGYILKFPFIEKMLSKLRRQRARR